MEIKDKLIVSWKTIMQALWIRLKHIYKSDIEYIEDEGFITIKDWSIKVYFINNEHLRVQVYNEKDAIMEVKYTGNNLRAIVNCIELILNVK